MKKERGITLVGLVITIIVLLILAGITISLTLGERGIFNKAEQSVRDTSVAKAEEEMRLKLLEIEKEAILQMPESKMKFIAEKLKSDNDIEYVLTSSQVATTDSINFGNATKIYTKLKKYLYEFEIDSTTKILEVKKLDPDFAIISVEKVEVTPASSFIEVGKTVSLTATVLPEKVSDKSVTWSSTNTDIATVNQEGIVTGVANGTCEILVTSKNGKNGTEVIGRCAITTRTKTHSVGDPITVKGTAFYVIKDSYSNETTITLLKKDCIEGTFQWHGAMAQGEAYASTLGVNATSRLITISEMNMLNSVNLDLLRGSNGYSSEAYLSYWSGSDYGSSEIYAYFVEGKTTVNQYNGQVYYIQYARRDYAGPYLGVRPVLEISKSLI